MKSVVDLYEERKEGAHPLALLHREIAERNAENMAKVHRGELDPLNIHEEYLKTIRDTLSKVGKVEASREEILATTTSLLLLALHHPLRAVKEVEPGFIEAFEPYLREQRELDRFLTAADMAEEIEKEIFEEDRKTLLPDHIEAVIRGIKKEYSQKLDREYLELFTETLRKIVDFYKKHNINQEMNAKAFILHYLYVLYHDYKVLRRVESLDNEPETRIFNREDVSLSVLDLVNRLLTVRNALRKLKDRAKDKEEREYMERLIKRIKEMIQELS